MIRYHPGKNCIILSAFFLLLALTEMDAECQAREWTGNINVFLGAKALDGNDWEPVDSQGEFGIEIDFKKYTWPISIAIDFAGAVDVNKVDNVEFESTTSEFNMGIRKIWVTGSSTRPFIGGGLAFISGEAKVTSGGLSVSIEDNGVGFWTGGGVYWNLTPRFNLGLEAKYTQADIDMAGENVDTGGTHFGLIGGYHW